MKLTERDRRLLATLGGDPQSAAALADALDRSPGEVAARLDALDDNGLVRAVGDGRYQRTESGRRLLRTGGGRADDTVDTSPAVEEAIAGADCRRTSRTPSAGPTPSCGTGARRPSTN